MLEGLHKVSHLAWKKLGILQEKVKEMPGETLKLFNLLNHFLSSWKRKTNIKENTVEVIKVLKWSWWIRWKERMTILQLTGTERCS